MTLRLYKRIQTFKCPGCNWNAGSKYALDASKLSKDGVCASCFLDHLEALGFVIEVSR